jgi:AbrB family looped-hinge helix DNA binding protein
MDTVTLSPKFQLVIPQSVREEAGLRPGQKFCVIRLGNRIELVPLRPIKEMRGFVKGMNTDFEREPDRL